jgi:hypothetical protein
MHVDAGPLTRLLPMQHCEVPSRDPDKLDVRTPNSARGLQHEMLI